MAKTHDLVLKNGTVVNQDGAGQRDIGITNGRIAAIGSIHAGSAGKIVDCTGLHILPGVIDSQVHFREPGLEHKEDLESGSRAAVLGGVTCVFEMPNTKPLTTSEEALADKVRRGTRRMHCDFAFWVGGTRDNAGDVAELERLPGAAGIKVFMGASTGNMLVDNPDTLDAIFREAPTPIITHCEDTPTINANLALYKVKYGDDIPVECHPDIRSREACIKSTRLAIALANLESHVAHVFGNEVLRLKSTIKIQKRQGNNFPPAFSFLS